MKHEKFSFLPYKIYYRTWFIGLPLRWKHFVTSIKDYKSIHLMDEVFYKGERCFVNNGTKHTSDGVHLWDICSKAWNEDGTRNCYAVPDSELTKAKNWCTIRNSLLRHYSWYMHCWYAIDVGKLLEKKGKKLYG